jgi:Ser/Thr protein kinase RdoA (MazF antagonist)
MELALPARIFEGFGLSGEDYTVQRIGSGLINYTFKLCAKKGSEKDDYILQKINTEVFREPERIARNHRIAANYLAANHPDYFFLTPVSTQKGNFLLQQDNDYWRLLPFITNAVTINEAHNPGQAYEAAKQFGKLANNLSGIELESLKPTIPNFHNLSRRYNDFKTAINEDPLKRKDKSEKLIASFLQYSQIAKTYQRLQKAPGFPDRLMHHDTKINNVMFDEETNKGVCVIDLDTLMPGKIISDLGDMIRTYVSPASEEETNFARVVVRDDYYEALMNGYLSELGPNLTPIEKEVLFYSGLFMTYMQGIRYLTDYLQGDVYYGAEYPDHNYNRAKNQLTLLEALNKKEDRLKRLITSHL